MATSITAAGIVFPDSSVQTTAATAGGGTTEAIASGALSDGSKVIVNADGTVSAVVLTTVSQATGSATTFTANQSRHYGSTYDSLNNKVIIAYQDNGNSGFGTVVVGTVSGTSISFGTAVVFEIASTDAISATFDSTNNKVVIAYRDNGNSSYGTAIVGTVSGTSISFGTPVVFSSTNTPATTVVYDSVNNKIVVAYKTSNIKSKVGTVSGTSISFGAEATASTASGTYPKAVFDAVNAKVVVSYNDPVAGDYPTVVVGSVSGTTISYGTPVVVNSALNPSEAASISYDSFNNKIVMAYGANVSGVATLSAKVGTVSGTSISFGSVTSIATADSSFIPTFSTFDSTYNKVILAYRTGTTSAVRIGTVSGTSISFGGAITLPIAIDQSLAASRGLFTATFDTTNGAAVLTYASSSVARSVVFISGGSIVNLTSENFIGISDAAYADGATATIQIAGAVDDAQSGLTPGQKYYVRTNGTLNLTPGTPSVFAGTAISATKLVVQG